MTTQTETIVWHKYPEEKPPFGWILIDTLPDHEIDLLHLDKDKPSKLALNGLLAWAELPKGWRDDK